MIYFRWLLFIAIPFIICGVAGGIFESLSNSSSIIQYVILLIVGGIVGIALKLLNPSKSDAYTWGYMLLMCILFFISNKLFMHFLLTSIGMIVAVACMTLINNDKTIIAETN